MGYMSTFSPQLMTYLSPQQSKTLMHSTQLRGTSSDLRSMPLSVTLGPLKAGVQPCHLSWAASPDYAPSTCLPRMQARWQQGSPISQRTTQGCPALPRTQPARSLRAVDILRLLRRSPTLIPARVHCHAQLLRRVLRREGSPLPHQTRLPPSPWSTH